MEEKIISPYSVPGITKEKFNMEFIEAVVCGELDVDMDLLHARSQNGFQVFARQLIMYLGERYILESTLQSVGLYFGKNHCTVINAKKSINNYSETNKLYGNMIKRMVDIIEMYIESDISSYEIKPVKNTYRVFRDTVKKYTKGNIREDKLINMYFKYRQDCNLFEDRLTLKEFILWKFSRRKDARLRPGIIHENIF